MSPAPASSTTNRFGNLVVSSSRQYEHHYSPSDRFPFSYAETTDHFSGKPDAILKQPENVRIYAWLSTRRWSDPIIKEPKRGIRANYFNIVRTSMSCRATLDMIDRWATAGTPLAAEPEPRRSDGAPVSLEDWKKSFPKIPEVALPKEPNRLEFRDYGPRPTRASSAGRPR